VLEGRKTATCGPKSEFTEQELAATMASKGKIVPVVVPERQRRISRDEQPDPSQMTSKI
jgi:uncharacterized protein YhfF